MNGGSSSQLCHKTGRYTLYSSFGVSSIFLQIYTNSSQKHQHNWTYYLSSSVLVGRLREWISWLYRFENRSPIRWWFFPNPSQKIFATSIWIISPNSDENKKYLKPPLSHTLLILQIPTSKSLVSWFTTDSDAGAGGGTGVETLACIRNVAERGWGRYVLGSHGVLSIVLTGLLHIFSTSSCRFLPNGNEFLPKKEPPNGHFSTTRFGKKQIHAANTQRPATLVWSPGWIVLFGSIPQQHLYCSQSWRYRKGFVVVFFWTWGNWVFQFFTIERSDSNLDHLPSFGKKTPSDYVSKHDLVMDDKMRYKISGTTNKRHIESTKINLTFFRQDCIPGWLVLANCGDLVTLENLYKWTNEVRGPCRWYNAYHWPSGPKLFFSCIQFVLHLGCHFSYMAGMLFFHPFSMPLTRWLSTVTVPTNQM